jgi:uncharacterized protein
LKIVSAIFIALLCFACNSEKKEANGNELSAASSPYLQQHADNPVSWYEWGDQALARAKAENKPLLISIGYASCHWCHVMEKESFMDTSVARIMNENFINIKVDREERPDIDNIYMNACQLLTGGGGWPLNAFALPDGKPFFAGTYYSKERWKSLLKEISKAYREKNELVRRQAGDLTKEIARIDTLGINRDSAEQGTVARTRYHNLFDSLYANLDLRNGGLKGAPKFPMPAVNEFILQYHYLTGDKKALDAVDNTLTRMALGGMYDHVGGGFARYSTDTAWRVPHFEKMLYDNGQLLSLYAHAYQVTKKELFKNVIRETAAFADRELRSSNGGFYSSLNADTDEGEGDFYTWTYDQFVKLAGKEGSALAGYYNLKPEGNWNKGKNILYVSAAPIAAIDKQLAGFSDVLAATKTKLLTERNKRTRPATDDKILTSWNAIMMKGYLDAYCAIGESSYLAIALANAAFMEKYMVDADGHVWRSFRNGKASINGFLDDYAQLARAYIRLYQVNFDKRWLDLANRIAQYAVAHFADKSSPLFYYAADTKDALAVRKKEISDEAIPSSNAVMAEVLYYLSHYFEQERYRSLSAAMFSGIAGKITTMTSYYGQWCYVSGVLSHNLYEVAVMGKNAVGKSLEMQRNFLPDCIFMGETDEENLPLLENKLVGDRTIIYVCTNKSCRLPVEEVSKALRQIKQH